MSDINIKVKIPAEWYAGFSKSNDGLPTVIMTPNGTDKASQGRINTVKRFSYGDRGIPDAVLDNKPLCGFKIVKPATGYATNKIVWLIEDPRGFKSEIPSGNMGQLLALTTVDHCEILESCVWARDGKDNVLLPTNSVEYQTAVKNTTLAKQSVHISKVAIGNVVNLKNGKRNMIYLGKYYEFHGIRDRYYPRNDDLTKISDNGNFYYLDSENLLHHYGNGNVAEIVDTKTMTPEEAELLINEKQSALLTSVQPNPDENFKVNLVPVDLQALVTARMATFSGNQNMYAREYHPFAIMAEFTDGRLGYCEYPMLVPDWRNEHKITFKIVDPGYFYKGKLKVITSMTPNQWNRRPSEQEVTKVIDLQNPLDPAIKFSEVELTWTTPHGEFSKKLAS